MKKSELIFSALLVPVDFLMFVLAGIAAYFLRVSPLVAKLRPVLFTINLPFERYFFLLLAVSVLGLIIFAIVGLYNISPQKKLFKEFLQIIVGASATLLVIVLYIFFKQTLFDSRFIILAAWILAIILVSSGRFFVKKLQRFMVGKYNVGVKNVLIIGEDRLSRKVVEEMKRSPDLGYRIMKIFFEIQTNEIKNFILNGNSQVDEVILASPHYERNDVLELLDFCEEHHIGFKFVPSLFQAHTMNVEMNTFDGVPLIEIKRTPLDGWGKIAKRTLDIVGSIILIILFSPIMLVTAVVIKLDSEGSVFFSYKRIGQNGKSFTYFKFRSMYKDAHKFRYDSKFQAKVQNVREGTPMIKFKDDPRITKVGSIIRKYKIDELPEFFNVFIGKMSLVGPRPHEPEEVAVYQKHHKKVLLIKPGITGMAQISGNSDVPFEEEVKLDTYYIENWTLLKDIYILMKTITVIFKNKSVY